MFKERYQIQDAKPLGKGSFGQVSIPPGMRVQRSSQQHASHHRAVMLLSYCCHFALGSSVSHCGAYFVFVQRFLCPSFATLTFSRHQVVRVYDTIGKTYLAMKVSPQHRATIPRPSVRNARCRADNQEQEGVSRTGASGDSDAATV